MIDKYKNIPSDPIGIFDSGIGGISVVNTLRECMPEENIIYYGDSLYAPYGTKKIEDVRKRVEEISKYLLSKKVKAIVIACNTATSTSAALLREKYDIPIIGMEPALKPAVDDGHKTIAVMATELTLKEKKFSDLMDRFTDNKILKVPASMLVDLVEHGKIDKESVYKSLDIAFDGIKIKTLDAVVLGCTHFLFAKDLIKNYPNLRAQIYHGNYGTVNHLKNILLNRDLLQEGKRGTLTIENSDRNALERTISYVR